MRNEKRILMTDTAMRDSHQSLLATRRRTYDIAGIAGTYAHALPNLLSLELVGNPFRRKLTSKESSRVVQKDRLYVCLTNAMGVQHWDEVSEHVRVR